MAVIYKATNTQNGKSYIGFTKETAAKRFRTHCRKGHGLHEAIKKNGAENFSIEILEQSDDWLYLVSVREPHYIAMHDTREPNGYNRTKGGEYSNLQGVAVDVYDLNLCFVETVESISECARKYNLARSNLSFVCIAAKQGKSSRLGDHYFCCKGDSVRKKLWNTSPGTNAARAVNTGKKRPEHSKLMKELNEDRRDTSVYTFQHKNGEIFTGTRYDLKTHDPSVSIGELGVLIKGGYKSHRGWTIGK